MEGCGRKHTAHGLCNRHYLRLKRRGSLDDPIRPDGCRVGGCDREHFGRGYCSGHYTRLYEHGDLRESEPLRPFRPGVGYINAKGYRVDGQGRLEHRVAMERMLGRALLPGENVHHRNGVRDDSRESNLELWIISQPSGQRVEDVVAHALAMLSRYAPATLAPSDA